jgi:alpha-amylase
MVEQMGFSVILAEGAEKILGRRTPNQPYRPAGCARLKLLLRNYRLSDDVAFRFSDRHWPEYPLTAAKYAHWLHRIRQEATVINLFMDYETFGEHQWPETGIFDFLWALPGEVLHDSDFRFLTPAEVAQAHEAADEIDAPGLISWADEERDMTAWLGNAMQQDAARRIYEMEPAIRPQNDADLLRKWRILQTSDHFYYMCTKWFADGDVHRYFNPFESPYEAYINYMNILDDLGKSIAKSKGETS